MPRMSHAALLIDSLIIIGYFALIMTIGLSVGRRRESLEDYALGGRQLPWWAIMASIISAETSAATFIGAPAEGYRNRGLIYAQLAFGIILARIIIAYLFLKPYYHYRVYTVYDFLNLRFGPWTKNYVSALFLLMRTLASGVRLFIPALVMVLAWRLFVRQEASRFGTLESWHPYVYAIVVLTILTCIYTAVGGIKAVIWTDCIQSSVMFTSALIAIGTILWRLGDGSLAAGFATLARHVPEMKTTHGYFLTGFEGVTASTSLREIVKHLLQTKYTLVSAIFAYTIFCIGAYGTDQDMAQRMLTAKDYYKSRRSVIMAGIMDLPIFVVFAFIGVLLIAFYELHPQLAPGKANDVFGQFILSVMPVGIRGIVLAGVFATAMGSTAAAMNALATSLTKDWYIPYFAPNAPPSHYVTAARLATLLFAVLLTIIAIFFAYLNVKNPGMTILPVALGVAGYILGPMLGVFLIGMLTRTRGSDAGNMLAVTCGLAAVVLASKYLHIEFTWYVFAGSSVTFLIGVLFATPASRRARLIARSAELESAAAVI